MQILVFSQTISVPEKAKSLLCLVQKDLHDSKSWPIYFSIVMTSPYDLLNTNIDPCIAEWPSANACTDVTYNTIEPVSLQLIIWRCFENIREKDRGIQNNQPNVNPTHVKREKKINRTPRFGTIGVMIHLKKSIPPRNRLKKWDQKYCYQCYLWHQDLILW